MAKPSKNRERAARIEALRREQQRAERRRTLLVVVVCGVVALAIVGATAWKLISDAQRAEAIADTEVSDIGPSADAAGCGEITTAPAKDQGVHPQGQNVDYTQYGRTPPAFGAHWDLADFDRKFYTVADRPEVENLVHNLEHGYTVMWYDESIADDPDAVQTMEDLAEKFEEVGSAGEIAGDVETYNTGKFIAAPWTAEDGGEFPEDANVVLAHWAYEGDAFEEGEVTGEGQGMGVWQSCDQPSGEAVASFMAEYPASNSPEPNGA